MAVYVQFNRFIDLTKNSHANPYHLASTELTVVRAGCPVCAWTIAQWRHLTTTTRILQFFAVVVLFLAK